MSFETDRTVTTNHHNHVIDKSISIYIYIYILSFTWEQQLLLSTVRYIRVQRPHRRHARDILLRYQSVVFNHLFLPYEYKAISQVEQRDSVGCRARWLRTYLQSPPLSIGTSTAPLTVWQLTPSPPHTRHLSSTAVEPRIRSQPTCWRHANNGKRIKTMLVWSDILPTRRIVVSN